MLKIEAMNFGIYGYWLLAGGRRPQAAPGRHTTSDNA
jgi:hypothetical protein